MKNQNWQTVQAIKQKTDFVWKTHSLGLICPFYDLSYSVISPEDWIEIIHLILVDTEMLSVN